MLLVPSPVGSARVVVDLDRTQTSLVVCTPVSTGKHNMSRITNLHSDGFSLLELAAVLAVTSIVAAVLVLRPAASTERNATTRADELRRNLAHVQQLALGWGVSLRLTVAANGYTVTCQTVLAPPSLPCSNVGDVPLDPATGDLFTVDLTDDNVTLGPVGNTVDFDSLGRPTTSGTLIATNPARTYTFTGGTRTAQVLLRPITGFAETSY